MKHRLRAACAAALLAVAAGALAADTAGQGEHFDVSALTCEEESDGLTDA